MVHHLVRKYLKRIIVRDVICGADFVWSVKKMVGQKIVIACHQVQLSFFNFCYSAADGSNYWKSLEKVS